MMDATGVLFFRLEHMDFQVRFDIAKAEPSGKFVRGFCSVVSKNGEPVVDEEGDVIDIADLTRAAHRFISDARVAKVVHRGEQIGDIVESVLIDDEFAKELGMADGRRGWWIGMEIHNPSVQQRVAKGELRAFSLGGSGRRADL